MKAFYFERRGEPLASVRVSFGRVNSLWDLMLLVVAVLLVVVGLSGIAIIGRIFQMQMEHHTITIISDEAKTAQPAPTTALD